MKQEEEGIEVSPSPGGCICRERTKGGSETDPALTKQRKETGRCSEVPFVSLEQSVWER